MNNDELTDNRLAVAETIFSQLGGKGRLVMFVGARNFAGNETSAQFQFPSPHGGPTKCHVKLEPSDTYTVTFSRGSKITSVHDDIYCDQLVDLFERQAGLYLHF